MLKISTSVQQTTEVVVLMPAALTMWAALTAPVCLDTPEMDLPVQVNYIMVKDQHIS